LDTKSTPQLLLTKRITQNLKRNLVSAQRQKHNGGGKQFIVDSELLEISADIIVAEE
jgi:hypothetical protein